MVAGDRFVRPLLVKVNHESMDVRIYGCLELEMQLVPRLLHHQPRRFGGDRFVRPLLVKVNHESMDVRIYGCLRRMPR